MEKKTIGIIGGSIMIDNSGSISDTRKNKQKIVVKHNVYNIDIETNEITEDFYGINKTIIADATKINNMKDKIDNINFDIIIIDDGVFHHLITLMNECEKMIQFIFVIN